ncbi:ALMS1 protein, partial [Polioptila caerulea]|nr:ALMS1 protein [Polioptila caerulea]
GDLEIVSSGTRRNTRDVGVTFPTPRSSQQLQDRQGTKRSRRHFQPGQGIPSPLGESWNGNKGPWLGWTAGTGIVSNLLSLLCSLTGTPWLTPAEDLTFESRKENQSSATPGPGPAWFEPWSSTKPWREPLRERNWEQQPSRAPGA